MDAIGQVRRAEQVAAAIHSARLAGTEPSAEWQVDAQAYVEGLIDTAKVVRRTRERYGLD
ncbi:hypothetical protein EXE59_09735 [Nocardioides eburneiflavus]|uniref:Antitoxin VbhA domain-containing protein n=1 Tax=Nocardioides eburneiflavus TaxID=2518372 RepID=A0A4Z1CMC6_9ACTN|nr:antitoxin VbhA family protein [Nocardioides eburneiflavus]TGN64199.1 hypothetical protein EXE59_09735 [Nocardioides eburneiflavus]